MRLSRLAQIWQILEDGREARGLAGIRWRHIKDAVEQIDGIYYDVLPGFGAIYQQPQKETQCPSLQQKLLTYSPHSAEAPEAEKP